MEEAGWVEVNTTPMNFGVGECDQKCGRAAELLVSMVTRTLTGQRVGAEMVFVCGECGVV